MTLEERIKVLVQLGRHISRKGDDQNVSGNADRSVSKDEYLEAVAIRTERENPWFTQDNIKQAVAAIANQMLSEEALRQWADHYKLSEPTKPQVVGLVLAGNIPLVGVS